MNANDDNTARELAGVILGRHYENYDNSYYREDLDVTAQRIAVALRNAREDERAAIEMREQLPALLTDLQANTNDDMRIAEIRERCELASDGPWVSCGGATPKFSAVQSPSGYIVFRMADNQEDKEQEKLIHAPSYQQQWRNKEFIANARSDIPYLLEKITALESQLAQRPVVANSATTAEMPTPRTDAEEVSYDLGTMNQRMCVPSRLARELEREITALEAKLAEADRRALNAPDKCPITQLPFFMAIEHPDLGVVPTYGGPFDSYTIPQLCDPKEKQPWHEIEMDRWRYDHDVGGWTEMESIPIRLIHEDVLNELLDTQTELSTLRRQVEEAKRALADIAKPALGGKAQQARAQAALQQLAQRGEGK